MRNISQMNHDSYFNNDAYLDIRFQKDIVTKSYRVILQHLSNFIKIKSTDHSTQQKIR